MIRAKIAEAVAAFLKKEFEQDVDSSTVQIEVTRKEFEGDYTLVVFPFVRMMKCKPEQAAESLGDYLQDELADIVGFGVLKGFLNLNLSAEYWTNQLEATITDTQWTSKRVGDELMLVEFSSPNTNKPLHLGHLRNIFLGHSVSLINEFEGKNVVKTQIINDRGVHICKSMFAWKMHGKGETPKSVGMKGDKYVGKYYVMYDDHLKKQVEALVNKGLEEDQAKKEAMLTKKVQEMLIDWENGDEETRELWKMMNGWVYEGFDETYERMGVSFDYLYYESDTYLKGKSIVEKGLDQGLFIQKDDGSIWVDLKQEGLDQKLLVRADGTTVYMTQDIGTAAQRYEDYPNLERIVHTVGDEQDYHFQVLFLTLHKLGFSWAEACRHLSYGMVDLPTGKMKSREGKVVDADDLMEEVVNAAKSSSLEKGKLNDMDEAQQAELFEILGIGALKFFLLRVDPRKRMLFNPEESVALTGDTGPFVQYTYARCRAVLRKGGTEDIVGTSLSEISDKERHLMRELRNFRQVTKEAAESMNPSAIASYVLDIAKLYNQFYHDIHILNAEGDERKFRLGLTSLTAQTIKTSMSLLGIRVPERM